MGSQQNEAQETYRSARVHAAFHLAEPKGKLNEQMDPDSGLCPDGHDRSCRGHVQYDQQLDT